MPCRAYQDSRAFGNELRQLRLHAYDISKGIAMLDAMDAPSNRNEYALAGPQFHGFAVA